MDHDIIYFPNVMKIYKFILYNTLMMCFQKFYSVVKDLFHTKAYFLLYLVLLKIIVPWFEYHGHCQNKS